MPYLADQCRLGKCYHKTYSHFLKLMAGFLLRVHCCLTCPIGQRLVEFDWPEGLF